MLLKTDTQEAGWWRFAALGVEQLCSFPCNPENGLALLALKSRENFVL